MEFYAKGVFLTNILLCAYGYPVKLSEVCNKGSRCFKIDQGKKPSNCSFGSITADIGEKVISATPDEGFFLPEAPRSIRLQRNNSTHASVYMVPSRAGVHGLKYYLLEITEEAEGPKVYTNHILVNVSAVKIRRETTFNYSCIFIHPGVFRMFVKVWALSGIARYSHSSLTFKKGKYSMKMSNYLTVSQQVIPATENENVSPAFNEDVKQAQQRPKSHSNGRNRGRNRAKRRGC